MSYAKELGTLLAEELQELVLLDEDNLHEIRDLKTLKGHIKAAGSKYGVKHPKYKALLKLHAKKQAAEERKTARMAHIKERQEFHAKKHGYKKAKGSNTWKHESGHTLSFDDDRSWHHVKAGRKRGVGGGATPLRDLQRHLRSLHEDADLNGRDLNEIRGLYNLRQHINKSLLSGNPEEKQRAMRLQALERRKQAIALSRLREDESDSTTMHGIMNKHGWGNVGSGDGTTKYTHAKHPGHEIHVSNKGTFFHQNTKKNVDVGWGHKEDLEPHLKSLEHHKIDEDEKSEGLAASKHAWSATEIAKRTGKVKDHSAAHLAHAGAAPYYKAGTPEWKGHVEQAHMHKNIAYGNK
jgi:hypothetical protein